MSPFMTPARRQAVAVAAAALVAAAVAAAVLAARDGGGSAQAAGRAGGRAAAPPAGQQNGGAPPGFAQFEQCLRQNGVTLSTGVRPDRSDPAFQTALAACRQYLPARPGGPRTAPPDVQPVTPPSRSTTSDQSGTPVAAAI